MNGNELSAETLEQLEVLEQSKFLTWVLVAGILLSIGNIELQEQELVTGVQNEEIFPRRMTGNVLTFVAILYFYNLAEKGLDNESVSSKMSYSVSFLSLLAFIIGVGNTLGSQINNSENLISQDIDEIF